RMIFFTRGVIAMFLNWNLVIRSGLSAYGVGRIKEKQTKKTPFIPTVFLMIVFWVLELPLVLRPGYLSFIILMLVPVLVANAYQILILHKVTAVDPEHQARIEARRKARREAKEKQAAEKRVKKKN